MKHHEIDEILFWPDAATCYYARIVADFLANINIDFVSKKGNLPNVPKHMEPNNFGLSVSADTITDLRSPRTFKDSSSS